jgi:hypothetical protein
VEQAGALASDVLDQHGHVDVVVSNAGISIRRWVSQSYDRFRDFERTINLNYLGPVRLLLGLLESMRERGSGHIVNVSTVGVDLPALRWSAYIASKSAFETWLGGVAPEILADAGSVPDVELPAGHEHRRSCRDRRPGDRTTTAEHLSPMGASWRRRVRARAGSGRVGACAARSPGEP